MGVGIGVVEVGMIEAGSGGQVSQGDAEVVPP